MTVEVERIWDRKAYWVYADMTLYLQGYNPSVFFSKKSSECTQMSWKFWTDIICTWKKKIKRIEKDLASTADEKHVTIENVHSGNDWKEMNIA